MKQAFPVRMTAADVTIQQRKTVFQKFLVIDQLVLQHRLFAGGMSGPINRELCMRFRVGALLPYDPKLNQVVLLEQFRIGALEDETSPWLIELVAGILTDANESLTELVRRESQEEAGLTIEALQPICDYWVSPGASAERVALFCGKVDASKAAGIHGLAEEHEDIFVHTVAVEEAFAAVRQGRINNAATIIALQWLELNLARVRQQWHE